MTHDDTRRADRRNFLKTSAAGLAAGVAAPAIVTADKAASKPLVVGAGEHTYEVQHNWLQLPDPFTWQTTHNVAVDKAGHVYVIHEGRSNLKDHPSIFVFDADGAFIRAFGSQFQGGGHGLEVREEDGEEFLYVAAYQQVKAIAKLTLAGDVVWHQRAPMQSDRYAEGEDRVTEKLWGRDRFLPTNFAFLDDGRFVLADGYGAHCMHIYSPDGVWQSSFGGHGKADGQFNLPHGVWIDRRSGAEQIAVADRANARLQWFTTEGEHLKTLGGFMLPANIDTYGDVMLVPDLKARVTLLGKDNEVITHLGEDPAWREQVLADGFKLRGQPGKWRDGRFLHPHDACFDGEGNILVAEWVHTGRASRLRLVDA